MKQSPQMKVIQEQMKPGVLTLHGFLGNDSRSLSEILDADAAEVRRLGTTHQAIADRMRYFRKEGEAGLGEFTTVDSYFDVKVESVRGKIPSPFGGPGLYAKTNTTVLNKQLNRSLVFTDINIHLIGEHGFYEGKGSPFRLEPRALVEILEIPREAQQVEIPR
ncbi:hypothetical protein [Sediminispirochaeta bajacaliforniensis]|jgi:hypothetical protein|uniref:hypothetical protein n=1 Tax=Sediminispirochaeta bajacaliforniensis TaxID=148 RepID=UPI0003A86C4F|nr:hypothetical protein [Sediminispirochaeta bajacaliforniensis]